MINDLILNRARHLYSNRYIISDSVKFEFNQMYLKEKGKWLECEQDTRSINFRDMIDSEGTKIFASLSEDGKGGDRITPYNHGVEDTLVYKDTSASQKCDCSITHITNNS